MKTLNKALLEANKVDKLKFATLVAGLFSVLSLQAQTDAAAPSIADTLSSPATHLADTSSTQSQRSGSFVIDPSYSPTDKLITTRFAGGGSIHGIKVGGFLDLSLNPDIHTAFGIITASKGLSKGVSVAVEYTLHSDTPDKVRAGLLIRHKLANGNMSYKLYPLGDKGLEPFVVLGVDQKIGDKIFTSAFMGVDGKNKAYYGEAEITHKISNQIDALLQTRVGGNFNSKPKAGAYLGARVKF